MFTTTTTSPGSRPTTSSGEISMVRISCLIFAQHSIVPPVNWLSSDTFFLLSNYTF
jgi:hypothetical protein